MDLQQIKYFLAVVDQGTFRSAAKHSYVTQPTLSAGIKKLEESLDVGLFHRGSRTATLTPEGQQFLPVARQAYNQLMAIRTTLKQTPEKIVIGVQNNIHMDYVAQLIGNHRHSHPHIFIEILVADADTLNKQLNSGKLDLTLMMSSDDPGHQHSNFIPLFSEQLCIVVNKSHPLAAEKSVNLTALNNELFIERMNCSYWQLLNQEFQQQQIQPNTIMQSESDEFVLSLVAAGLGVSVVSQRKTPYAVKFIPINNIDIQRTIGICLSNENPSSAAQGFYNLIAH